VIKEQVVITDSARGEMSAMCGCLVVVVVVVVVVMVVADVVYIITGVGFISGDTER